jgi:hypothetical protein
LTAIEVSLLSCRIPISLPMLESGILWA